MIARWRVFLGFMAGAAYLFASHVAGAPRAAAGLLAALAGLCLRGWAAGYLEKGKKLAQDGPYGWFRHPLYTGSFLLALGFIIAGTGTSRVIHGALLWAVFLLLFVWIYPRRIIEEESSLAGYFGDGWRAFTASRRRFLPTIPPVRRENPDVFSWERYRKNREYQAFFGWLAGAVVIFIKGWWGF